MLPPVSHSPAIQAPGQAAEPRTPAQGDISSIPPADDTSEARSSTDFGAGREQSSAQAATISAQLARQSEDLVPEGDHQPPNGAVVAADARALVGYAEARDALGMTS